MKRFLAPLCTLVAAGVMCAAQASQPSNSLVRIYPRAQEFSLALAAAPAALRDRAGVYVFTSTGYVKARDSMNGFTCIVNRDGPHNEKPTCYDAVGSKYILPVDVRVGGWLLDGASVATIKQRVMAGFRDGTFHVVDRPGVAYMLSDHNVDYIASTGKTIVFPPHIMFYAPYLTNRDIGSAGDFAMGLPSIGYQGPLGFIIVPCGAYCGQPLKMKM